MKTLHLIIFLLNSLFINSLLAMHQITNLSNTEDCIAYLQGKMKSNESKVTFIGSSITTKRGSIINTDE